ncbi:Predicted nuclease, contains PIN domain, potential toxin-antitoxin system component [Ensifer adhaerens]|nr:Predicted nuclease, contains PIN domain, potential toxin-antitoxin system component [Ensifer adhaerens]
MKFLIDECLHTSLVKVAQESGHEGFHVNWLGWSGETDWDLMPRIVAQDFTFVTNNARDFRKLFAKEELHAGLIIIVPQVLPSLQRDLFAIVLQTLEIGEEIINEVMEISMDGNDAVLRRYTLPES